MNNQYIQYPQKWSLKPSSREYFSISIFGRKYQASFYNVSLVLHKLYELYVTHGHDFSKTTYPAVKNASRFSIKISIWTCWDVGVEIPSDCLGKVVQNSYKTLERSVTKVRHRCNFRCDTLVAWQRWHVVLVFAPKRTQRWKRRSSSVG